MPHKLLTLAATGLVGLALGAGVGVAAAQGPTPAPSGDPTVAWMDDMHDAMRDQMPADLAEQCDELHGSMPDQMAGIDMTAMHRSDGSMMSGSSWHAGHHGSAGS